MSARSGAVVAVVVLLAGGAGAWWWQGRGKHGDPGAGAPPAAGETGDGGAGAARAPAKPTTPPGAVAADDAPMVLADDEPRGALRLEGQVVDASDAPVGGAQVAIDSLPPRVVVSEQDGSFAIDGLVGRVYRVEARAGGAAASAELRVHEAVEPVILRVAAAGRVEVEVRAARDDAPVAGAEVELRATLSERATTGADGKAAFAGVGAAWLRTLVVRAPGFAPQALRLPTSGDATAVDRVVVRLVAGAPVRGRVVDEGGKPVAGARVLALDVTQPFPVVDPRRDAVLTGADGRFAYAALAAGTVRFTATHEDFGPGTSPPLGLDGVHAREVEVRLPAGARLDGKVVDAAGKPVAGAEVRALARGGLEWRYGRVAVSDAAGKFALRGLPRRAFDVVARHEGAASALVPAALDAGSGSVTVTLTLEVTAGIAGVVVGKDGAPVAEAQVLVEPAWSGAAGEREAWQVRRVPRTVADQAGGFRVGGLPAGKYLVRAARPGAAPDSLWLREGVLAAAGDEGVKVVLAADGKLKGKVAFADGGAPELYTVAVGPARPVPVSGGDGAFAVDAPGGVFNVTIEGPGLEPKIVPGVEIDGEEDLGTITVRRGRSVSGRVLDAAGAPVPGATVAAGNLLTGGGAELYIADESLGAKATETDADGRFVISGFGRGAITLVAGKDGVGRAPSVRVPGGEGGAVLDLVLQPTGALAGTVTREGKPLAETVIIANPIAASGSNFFVITGADGSFALTALAGGEYVVSAMIGGGGPRPKDMFMRRVKVVPGAEAKVTIDATPGTTPVTITPLTEEGGPVPAAQVLLATGRFEFATAGALRDGEGVARLFPSEATVTLFIRMALGGKPAVVEKVAPGTYTACVVPMPVDPSSPRAMPEDPDALPMRCVPVEVAAGAGAAGGEGPKVEVKVPKAWTEKAAKP